MAERKTVTKSTMIGEGGISLISTCCLEMGFLFHPRRVDHGIDGHIDLVDQGTGASTASPTCSPAPSSVRIPTCAGMTRAVMCTSGRRQT
ncbi:MAG: hypothetical protein ACRDOI_24115 [Trebonia sp.]